MSENKLDFGPDAFARELNVSRETLERLRAFVALLTEWNLRHNLVSERSLADVWRRHVLDSAQLTRFMPPSAKTLIDLGSGAGFPGMIVTAMRPDLHVTLVEATAKKCRFLGEAATLMHADVQILNARIEDLSGKPFDVVSARACAPLPRLATYAQRFVGPNTVCLFLKGQNVGSELTETRKSWRMKLQSHASMSDPAGTVLEIHGLAPQ